VAKRFTETDKWRDGWFLQLTAVDKLAWQYVCDNCDHAGIIEIVEHLANLQIGLSVDWPAFVVACGHRIEELPGGKLWIKAFCEFQYGELNPENRVHRSVLKRLEAAKLLPEPKAVKPIRQSSAAVSRNPPTLTEVREYMTAQGMPDRSQAFVDYYSSNGWKQKGGNAIKDWKAAVRTWKNREERKPAGRSVMEALKA
jgi:hypothetical protein